MKLNKIIPTIISLFSFFAIIMNAQEQLNLRLDDCISLAIENNKKITIAQARMQSAQAKVDESNSAMLPQLRLNSRAALLSKVDEFTLTLPLAPPEPLFPSITHNYSVKLSLHQPVFMGFRLQKAKEMNEYNAAGAMEDYSKDIADLKFEVTSAYWNYFRAIRTNVTMEKSLELVSQLLKDIKELMNQGMATEADVLKIETRLSDVTLQKISIENNVRLSAMSLNNLIGKPLETKLVLSESIDTTLQKRIISTEEMNLPSLLSNAVQKRPELKSIALKKQMSEAGI